MFQGTGSDVGKSLLVAGIARAFKRRGLNVMPFKPQNMSNNAAVTNDGGEIGRAQELQAKACGVMPSVHMNPILLKPQSNMGSQIIVQGKIFGNRQASEYYKLKPKLSKLPYKNKNYLYNIYIYIQLYIILIKSSICVGLLNIERITSKSLILLSMHVEFN